MSFSGILWSDRRSWTGKKQNAEERDEEYDEGVHFTKDGTQKPAKKFKCLGGCDHLVDWGSLAYRKNFTDLGIQDRRELVVRKFCCVKCLKDNKFVKHNKLSDCRAKNCAKG